MVHDISFSFQRKLSLSLARLLELSHVGRRQLENKNLKKKSDRDVEVRRGHQRDRRLFCSGYYFDSVQNYCSRGSEGRGPIIHEIRYYTSNIKYSGSLDSTLKFKLSQRKEGVKHFTNTAIFFWSAWFVHPVTLILAYLLISLTFFFSFTTSFLNFIKTSWN